MVRFIAVLLCKLLLGNLISVQAEGKKLSKEYARVASEIIGGALVESEAMKN